MRKSVTDGRLLRAPAIWGTVPLHCVTLRAMVEWSTSSLSPRRGRAGAVAAAVLMLASAQTLAAEEQQQDNPHLAEAMNLIEVGDLESARAALDEAMAHPENTNEDLVDIYATLAVVHLYSGEEGEAYQAYVRLLNIDPNYELPAHTAGPLRELFERVARAYEEGHLRAVRVGHDSVGEIPAGVPALITATISNMPDTFSAKLRYRLDGEDSFESRSLSQRPGRRWAAGIPDLPDPEALDAPLVVEYYVEVINENGHRVQGSGSARRPHELRIVSPLSPEDPDAAETRNWYQRPWVWGSVGTVAAGTAAAVYLSARSTGGGSLPVRVRIREEL